MHTLGRNLLAHPITLGSLLPVWLWVAVVSLGPTPAAGQAGPAPGDQLFAPPGILRLHLTLSPDEFRALTPTGGFGGFGGFGPPPPPETDEAKRNTFGVEFPWSQATVELTPAPTQPGVPRTANLAPAPLVQVGLRFKGNYTYMASAQALKKPLKLDFNRHVKGQRLDGLSRLNLHTGVSDPTRLRESLAYAFFRDVGVPAPRTAFAEVRLSVPDQFDHELVGAYTVVEEVNKTFLARHFGDGGGLLMKPEGLNGGPGYRGSKWKSYEGLYHPDSKPTPAQRDRLIEFTRLIDRGTDAEFAGQIGEYLDIPAFLRFIAANTLLSNLDSYLGFGHNYYLYLVPGREQFVFIPWDLDLSLASWPAVGTPEQLVELSIHHPHAGKNALIDRLFAIETHQQTYLQLLREMLETHFTEERFLARLDAYEQQLAPLLAAEIQAVSNRQETSPRGPFGGGPPAGPGNGPAAGPNARPGGGPGGAPGAGGGPAGRPFGGRPAGGPPDGPPRFGGAPGGPGGPGGGFGGGFGGGQFGQSLPPRQFITRRLASVTAQLAGEAEGFEPQPFGFGGFGGGPPGGGPGFGGPGAPGPGGPRSGGPRPGGPPPRGREGADPRDGESNTPGPRDEAPRGRSPQNPDRS